MNQTIEFRQERDFGLKINATFTFIRENFKPLMKVLLYIVVPFALVGGIASGVLQNQMFSIVRNPETLRTSNPFSIYTQYLTLAGIFSIVMTMLAMLLLILITYSYVKIYVQGERQISPEMVWNEAKRHIGSSIIAGIVTVFLVFIGAIFCILPGIYISVVLTFLLPIIIFEDADFSYAFSESFNIIKDKWWSTFGLVIVMSMIVGVIGTIFNLPVMIWSVLSITMQFEGSEIMTIIFTTIATIARIILYALVYVAISFQYFNLVERRYGTKLAEDIANLGIQEDRPTMED